MEHRLRREEPADRDAVEAAREALVVPRLDRVRPPELVQSLVRVDDPGVDPARRVARSRAAADDVRRRRCRRASRSAARHGGASATARSRRAERPRAGRARTSRSCRRTASGRGRGGRRRAASRARGRRRPPRGRRGGRRAAPRGATASAAGSTGARSHPAAPGTLTARMPSERQITVGGVPIGGGAPVVVQSMTLTKTHDVEATTAQIAALASAGCEIVRVAVPKLEDANALPLIVRLSPLPVIADIHFNASLALRAIEAGVHAVRINPGNIGGPDKTEQVVKAARRPGSRCGSAPMRARCRSTSRSSRAGHGRGARRRGARAGGDPRAARLPRLQDLGRRRRTCRR